MLLREQLAFGFREPPQLTWVQSAKDFLWYLEDKDWSVCLVGYRLGAQTGVEVIREAVQKRPDIPFILLSGAKDPVIDFEASEAGASGFLSKVELNAETLERSIRYAIAGTRRGRELSSRQEQLEEFMRHLNVCVFVWRPGQGQVALLAGEPVALLGLNTQDRVLTTDDWPKPEDLRYSSFFEVLEEASEDAASFSRAIQLRLPDGSSRWFRASGLRTKDTESDGDRIEFCLNDVTAFENHALEMEESLGRAIEASRAKSEFLAIISHELRTPMNPIIGFGELLREAVSDPDQLEMLDMVRHSAQRLKNLIDDILEYSRMESGRIELHPTEFSLEEMVMNVVEALRGSFEQKGLYLALNIHSSVRSDLIVEADQGKLRQLLICILSNARKFTSEGGVEIRVNMLAETDDTVSCEFSIRDSGIGIRNEDLDRIFEPFVQSEDPSARNYEGAGLGLAICKRIVRQMGGSIHVTSRIGEGSEFRVVLALRRHRSSMPWFYESRPADSHSTESHTVMVVDDRSANVDYVRLALTNDKHTVFTARDGDESVDLYESLGEQIDVILMDLNMPGKDGFAAAKSIWEKQESGRRVPIIAMTAYASEEDRKKCLEFGFDDFLPKPFRPNALKEMVAKWSGDSTGEPERSRIAEAGSD